MAIPVHPRIHTRGTRDDRAAANAPRIRVLVYAPSETPLSWIESELVDEPVMVQIGHSVAQVVSALVEDPPPRPQVLIADFDAMNGGEIMHLHLLREQGWFGRILALGNVPASLRSSLSIDHALRPPFVTGALRDVIAASTFDTSTTKLPIL
jgi:hypothetical protein